VIKSKRTKWVVGVVLGLLTWRLVYATNLQSGWMTQALRGLEVFQDQNDALFQIILSFSQFLLAIVGAVVGGLILLGLSRRSEGSSRGEPAEVGKASATDETKVAAARVEGDSSRRPPVVQAEMKTPRREVPSTTVSASATGLNETHSHVPTPAPTAQQTSPISPGWSKPVDPNDAARAAEDIENDPTRWILTKGYPPGEGLSSILYNATTPTRNPSRRASLIVRRMTETSLGIFNRGPGDACDVRISVTSGHGEIGETRHWQYLNSRNGIEVPMVNSPPPFDWDLEVKVEWEDKEKKKNSQRFTI